MIKPESDKGKADPMQELATVFKALSDETRLRILKLLEGGELCVCHVVAACDMSQSRVSFHLAALKAAGFVKDRRDGKWMLYKLDDADLFRRLLILSVVERIPAGILDEDRRRLREFIAGAPVSVGTCCAGAAVYLGETEGRP